MSARSAIGSRLTMTAPVPMSEYAQEAGCQWRRRLADPLQDFFGDALVGYAREVAMILSALDSSDLLGQRVYLVRDVLKPGCELSDQDSQAVFAVKVFLKPV